MPHPNALHSPPYRPCPTQTRCSPLHTALGPPNALPCTGSRDHAIRRAGEHCCFRHDQCCAHSPPYRPWPSHSPPYRPWRRTPLHTALGLRTPLHTALGVALPSIPPLAFALPSIPPLATRRTPLHTHLLPRRGMPPTPPPPSLGATWQVRTQPFTRHVMTPIKGCTVEPPTPAHPKPTVHLASPVRPASHGGCVHQLVWLCTEDGNEFVMDFTGPQYGVDDELQATGTPFWCAAHQGCCVRPPKTITSW